MLLYFNQELYALLALGGVRLDNRHESSVFEGLKLRSAKKKKTPVKWCCFWNKFSFKNCIFNIKSEANDDLSGARKAKCILSSNLSAVGQEIGRVVWNLKGHHRTYKNTQLAAVLSKVKPIEAHSSNLFETRLNIMPTYGYCYKCGNWV